MPKVPIQRLKQLREETGISLAECQRALQQARGDLAKAKNILQGWGREVALKKESRAAKEGLIESYVHATGKLGVLVEVRCETDFVARSPDFKFLCHELALQAASMNPGDVNDLLSQEYIKDPGKTVKDLIVDYIAKLGENIVVERFVRFEM